MEGRGLILVRGLSRLRYIYIHLGCAYKNIAGVRRGPKAPSKWRYLKSNTFNVVAVDCVKKRDTIDYFTRLLGLLNIMDATGSLIHDSARGIFCQRDFYNSTTYAPNISTHYSPGLSTFHQPSEQTCLASKIPLPICSLLAA